MNFSTHGAISHHGRGEDVRAEAAGYASSRPPMTDYDYSQTEMPRPTSAVMPSMTMTAQVAAPQQSGAGMTPQSLVRTMPSIINTAPAVADEPCDSVSAWVGQNPMLAAGALLVLGFFVFGRGKG